MKSEHLLHRGEERRRSPRGDAQWSRRRGSSARVSRAQRAPPMRFGAIPGHQVPSFFHLTEAKLFPCFSFSWVAPARGTAMAGGGRLGESRGRGWFLWRQPELGLFCAKGCKEGTLSAIYTQMLHLPQTPSTSCIYT